MVDLPFKIFFCFTKLRKFYLQDLKMVLLVKIHWKHDLSAGKFRTKLVLVTKLSQTYCLSQSCH